MSSSPPAIDSVPLQPSSKQPRKPFIVIPALPPDNVNDSTSDNPFGKLPPRPFISPVQQPAKLSGSLAGLLPSKTHSTRIDDPPNDRTISPPASHHVLLEQIRAVRASVHVQPKSTSAIASLPHEQAKRKALRQADRWNDESKQDVRQLPASASLDLSRYPTEYIPRAISPALSFERRLSTAVDDSAPLGVPPRAVASLYSEYGTSMFDDDPALRLSNDESGALLEQGQQQDLPWGWPSEGEFEQQFAALSVRSRDAEQQGVHEGGQYSNVRPRASAGSLQSVLHHQQFQPQPQHSSQVQPTVITQPQSGLSQGQQHPIARVHQSAIAQPQSVFTQQRYHQSTQPHQAVVHQQPQQPQRQPYQPPAEVQRGFYLAHNPATKGYSYTREPLQKQGVRTIERPEVNKSPAIKPWRSGSFNPLGEKKATRNLHPEAEELQNEFSTLNLEKKRLEVARKAKKRIADSRYGGLGGYDRERKDLPLSQDRANWSEITPRGISDPDKTGPTELDGVDALSKPVNYTEARLKFFMPYD